MTAGGVAVSVMEDTSAVKLDFDDSLPLHKPVSHPVVTTIDSSPAPLTTKIKGEDMISEGPPVSGSQQPILKMEVEEKPGDGEWNPEVNTSSDPSLSAADITDKDLSTEKISDAEAKGTNSSSIMEFDQFSPDVSIPSTSEDTCLELPQLPPYVELSKDQESNIKYMAIKHIIESYKHLSGTDSLQFCMTLLARMVAQVIFPPNFSTL